MNKRLPFEILGLTIAYMVMGKLSLLLAIPPGYATAIWPPSGIALGAVLVYGYRVWPGILLGSMLVNASTNFDAGSAVAILESLAIPFGIACGAALQAVVGAVCVRRFANFPNPLASEREVFLLLIWGGPASCLVNSVIGSIVLLAAGKIAAANLLITLGTWWAGDTIGVFIFTPLLLVWTLRPDAAWKPRRLTVTLPIVVVFALTLVAVNFGESWERQRIKLKFDQQVATFAPALKQSLDTYIGALHSLEGFYAASDKIDRDEFRIFTDRPFGDLNGLQALSWNPRVFGTERAEFENSTRQEGFPDFQISERNAKGELIPAGNRSDYIPVHLIEPLQGNIKALGFDVASDPTRQMALELARDTGKAMATARITLVQETSSQFGVLVFMPVYQKGPSHITQDEHRHNLTGYMVGVFRGGDIVKAALRNLDQEGVYYRLLDESAPSEKTFLMENIEQGQGVLTLEEKGIFGGSVPIGRHFSIPFAGREWKLETSPTQEYLARHRQGNAWLFLIGGMLLTSLVGSFVMVVSGRSELLRNLVSERTRELAKSENHVRAIVDNEIDGIITTNDHGVIQSANPATETIFGYSRDDIIGKNVNALISGRLDGEQDENRGNILLTIGPKTGGVGVEVAGRRKDGTSVALELQVAEFHVGDEHLFLGMLRDITERKEVDRLKSEFVSTISHELRTPLTSIKGSLGMVIGGALGALPQQAETMINIANKNTERMISLVNDILDVEKLEFGNMEFDFQPLALLDLVTEAIKTNSGLAKEYEVIFSLSDLARNITVHGDANRLTQVITNLLSNAAKFSQKGGKVEISVVRHDAMAKVSVSDQGSGIPPEFKEHIFGRFSQADGSDTRKRGGSGLGLNISRSIIEKHDGVIGYDSEVGVGSTFFFYLPALD